MIAFIHNALLCELSKNNFMQYLVLLLAFLAECTLRPAYINTTFTIEIITITYFIFLLKTKHSMPAYIPATLLLIANIITNEVVGLQSLLLMMSSFLCNHVFIQTGQQIKIGSRGRKNSMTTRLAIIAFAVLFFATTLLRAIILQIFGYHTAINSEIFYYLINLVIFITIVLCINS